MTAEQDDLARVAGLAADAARAAILPLFRTSGLGVVNKGPKGADPFDPVTLADRAAERAMRTVLAQQRPDDAVLGEEYGATAGTSGLTWVLDPIDGTRAFLCGAPTWGVLIGLQDASGPIFGIIDQPHIGERFQGGFGTARVSGPHGTHPLRVRRGVPLESASLLTTFPEVGTDAERAAFGRVSQRVRLTRYGLDCYAYALLAAGQVDLVIEAGLAPYDIAAPIAVIHAAGGIVSDWQGGPAHHGGQIVAAGDRDLHQAALDALNA